MIFLTNKELSDHQKIVTNPEYGIQIQQKKGIFQLE